MSALLVLRSSVALLAAASFALSVDAGARSIRVDVGAGNYPNNGQAWDLQMTPLGGNPVVAGALPFAINFGAGNVTGFCLYENGFVGFASGCGSVPANVVRPLEADWVSDPNADDIFELGSVTANTGNLARGAIPPDPEDAPEAIRFTWQSVTCASCPGGGEYTFQAILIDMGNGDFDLELNYDSDVPAGIGVAGFSLGAFTELLEFPLLTSRNYDFQFRGGQLVNGNAVPEPGSLALLALAALIAGVSRKR